MSFTEVELALLAQHGYGPEDLYDGRDQAQVTWKAGAKAAGKDIILVHAGRCTKSATHRLKTRGGHCFECKPWRVSFVRRESVTGYVYIAGSLKARLVKIGMCEDSLSRREYKLRHDRYGGFDDWTILYSVKVNRAGEIERRAREQLRGHRVVFSRRDCPTRQRAFAVLIQQGT